MPSIARVASSLSDIVDAVANDTTLAMQANQRIITILSALTPRDDAKSPESGGNTVQAPTLSPSAIVGIAIVGAMFFCVASAAMLRYFQRPETEPNSASLYRPESDSQLEHMKQVREFNRAAALERAEEAREQGHREREKKVMVRVLRGEKMRRGSLVVAKEPEWRKKMVVSAMEAGGGFVVDEGEGWPLIGARGRDTVQRRETLVGGPRDYSDGAYGGTSSGNGGGSSGSGGDFEVMDLKGKQPENCAEVEEMRRLTTTPAMGLNSVPQRPQIEQRQPPTSVPDYYD